MDMALLECYYSSNPRQQGYMKKLWEKWMLRYPQSKLTSKHLTRCYNIHKQELLSQLQTQEIQPGSDILGYWLGANITLPPEIG